jgi:enamine deaminase RidA (YjgF/YER057c/UK114 family)
VRAHYILPNRADFPRVWPVLRERFSDARPACTMIQAGLMEEAMLIEIEVTARVGAGKRDTAGTEGAPPA